MVYKFNFENLKTDWIHWSFELVLSVSDIKFISLILSSVVRKVYKSPPSTPPHAI